jgi:hypothetical protein
MIFNPASNPGHHKANSMQINSKMRQHMLNNPGMMEEQYVQYSGKNSKQDVKQKSQINITKT